MKQGGGQGWGQGTEDGGWLFFLEKERREMDMAPRPTQASHSALYVCMCVPKYISSRFCNTNTNTNTSILVYTLACFPTQALNTPA